MAFGTAGALAMLGWLGLLISLFAPQLCGGATATARFLIPALIGIAYVVLLMQGWGKAPDAGFGSIEQVRALFSVDASLAAGWLHYLAFDLFVGSWIVTDGLERGVRRLLLVPCLVLTFLFGPAGLLLYLGLRLVTPRKAG